MIRIVDASVALKWFLAESDSERALEYLDQVLSNPRKFAVPELFYYELQNILYRFDLSAKQKDLFKALYALGWARFPMSPELSDLGGKYQSKGLSGYDASYAALAEFLDGIWITADRKAAEKLRASGRAKLF